MQKSLSPNVQQYIQEHLTDDINRLLLNAPKASDFPFREAIQQIAARQKAKLKLPTWYENKELIFPSALSVEQSSSERTANFKAGLVSGKLLIDLTGGMGIDMWAMSESFDRAVYVEQQADLKEITEHNLTQLGRKNIQFFQENSVQFLVNFNLKADCIYLDPHRRDVSQQKVVSFASCEPNVLKIKELLFEKTDKVLVKASPLMDIDLALEELQNVQEVVVVAVENEVKEVLFLMEKISSLRGTKQSTEDGTQSINTCPTDCFVPRNDGTFTQITAINLLKNNEMQTFSFQKKLEKESIVQYSAPLHYLYEPNAAILKSGAFKSVAIQFDLFKLHQNSHLYTSEELIKDFSGRIFELENVCKLDKKEVLNLLPDKKANITTRNFPLSVKEIRQKIGVQEGGNVYILATTLLNNQKVLLVCRKL